jgi:hypothetical protein
MEENWRFGLPNKAYPETIDARRHSNIVNHPSYSQHSFIAMNSLPNELDSLFCFIDHPFINAPFSQTSIPVLDLRDTVSDAWWASTFARMTNPLPCGSGAFSGIASWPSTQLNSLEVQSLLSTSSGSISG